MTRRTSRHLAALTGAVFLVTGCPTDGEEAASSATSPNAAAADGLLLTSAHYEVDWDWGAALPAADGQGFEVTTDLGYALHVTRGWLVSYSASLAECTPGAESSTTAAAAPGRPSRRLLAGLFGAGVAHAGHGGTLDPSITLTPQVEDLTAPGLTDLGTVSFSEADYCRLHWVAGAAGDATAGLPDAIDLLGSTLWLEGTWTAPGSTDAIPFVWSSPIANGVLVELADHLVEAPVEGADRAEIRVVRELDRWFDGIDFGALSEDDVGRALMIGLATSTVVEVRLTGGGDG